MVIDTPIGKIFIHCKDDQVCRVDLYYQGVVVAPRREFEQQVAEQFKAYFRGDLTFFDLPISLTETPYRNRVCQSLAKIPFGKTLSYGDLAKKLNSVPRAIGGACRHNPLPIILPCHRVVAKNGIGGFSGATSGAKIDIKTWLLHHEQSVLIAANAE